MKNEYKQLGPFVYGDPRFLAGGSSSANISYNDSACRYTSDFISPPANPVTSLSIAMEECGQAVSYGKSGYHGNSRSNVFIRKEDLTMPTIGVEVETIMRNCTSENALKFTRSVYSNWFHAENDGSLDQAHHGTYGYELVTTVLPARLYRDIDLWTGFQNLVSPLLHSYKSSETGLHVHVGMGWFENTKLPAMCPEATMLFGKSLTTLLYYAYLPRPLAQRVFLRSASQRYCHETSRWQMMRSLGELSGYKVIDEAMSLMLQEHSGAIVEQSVLDTAYSMMRRVSDRTREHACIMPNDRQFSSCALTYGHDCEVNASPKLTLEFRRGKGTTNALSIHRMIEMCLLVTTYAGHVIDNPGEQVSSRKLLEYVIENTKSAALKSLVEKEINKCA